MLKSERKYNNKYVKITKSLSRLQRKKRRYGVTLAVDMGEPLWPSGLKFYLLPEGERAIRLERSRSMEWGSHDQAQ